MAGLTVKAVMVGYKRVKGLLLSTSFLHISLVCGWRPTSLSVTTISSESERFITPEGLKRLWVASKWDSKIHRRHTEEVEAQTRRKHLFWQADNTTWWTNRNINLSERKHRRKSLRNTHQIDSFHVKFIFAFRSDLFRNTPRLLIARK